MRNEAGFAGGGSQMGEKTGGGLLQGIADLDKQHSASPPLQIHWNALGESIGLSTPPSWLSPIDSDRWLLLSLGLCPFNQ